MILILVLISLFFGWINYFYYSSIYPIQIGANKLSGEIVNNLGLSIISLSRSLIQILLPVKFAIYYSPSNFLNFIGLPLFSLMLVLLFNRLGGGELFRLIFLILHPLLFITFNNTNVFVSDTYLIYSIPGYILLLVAIFNKYSTTFKVTLCGFLVSLFSFKTIYEQSYSTNSLKAKEISYEREKDCRNAINFANALIFERKVQEFIRITRLSLANKCLLVGKNSSMVTFQVYSILLYLETGLSIKEKIERIEKVGVKNIAVLGVLRRLYKDDKNYDQVRYINNLIGDERTLSTQSRNLLKIIEEDL